MDIINIFSVGNGHANVDKNMRMLMYITLEWYSRDNVAQLIFQ